VACLDTTVIVDLIRRRPEVRARALGKLDELTTRGEGLFTTRLNLGELYLGVELSRDPGEEERRIAEVLIDLTVLDFDDSAAHIFAEISAHLRRAGRPIGDMDALIAATSMAAGHAIVTRNPEHFAEIPRLQVETY
jgi:predicted nucleic acid-binding protein